jgi:hypothetical protein
VPALLVYAVLAVTPALALLAAGHALERWCHRHPASGPAQPTGDSLERLVADLRRLEADYRRIAGSDLPGRVSRMRTVARAYDERLRDCCYAVGLPEPGVPLSSVDRLHTEAALAQQGVTW